MKDTSSTEGIEVVIIANGAFPSHAIPLSILTSSTHIVCCDGAIVHLNTLHIEPDAIIGDGDSIPIYFREKYAHKWHFDSDQETNDLTKAVLFCVKQGFKEIAIIGATGLREDHTLGNISLLLSYAEKAKVRMFTDFGVFTPITHTTVFQSFPNQQVSLFSLTPCNAIRTSGLQYPLNDLCIHEWWQGTLNAALDNSFTIYFEGKMIVFQTYEPKR